jgi:hypothetical protein
VIEATRLKEVLVVVTVDITADLNDENETGLVWTFLDEARDPAVIVPGAIVVAGDADAPAVVEVVDIVAKSARDVVHLAYPAGRNRGLRLRSFGGRYPRPGQRGFESRREHKTASGLQKRHRPRSRVVTRSPRVTEGTPAVSDREHSAPRTHN